MNIKLKNNAWGIFKNDKTNDPSEQMKNSVNNLRKYIYLLVMLMIAYAVASFVIDGSFLLHVTIFLIYILCTASVIIYMVKKIRKDIDPFNISSGDHDYQFAFNDEGFSSKGANYTARHDWHTVKKIERKSDMIMIYINTDHVYFFREAMLEKPDNFYQVISRLYSKNR